MTSRVIYGPRATELRDPREEQRLISFTLNQGETDMMCCDAVLHLIQTWTDEGGDFATACGRVLDMERADLSGEAITYDTDGNLVFLEPNVPLLRAEDCFGQSPRRCINHMRAKEGQTARRRVSVENLPRYFWIAVAAKIFDQIMG
jgi:uncharacterized SAM-dependent methyltransferase